jgi:protoheme IX farnesyltransferase
MTQTLRHIASLFKLRIGVAIMLSALAGLAVTPGPALPAWKVAVLALAVMLSSASAGALNQYFERDLDARMKRTRDRPFVTGAFQASPLWLAAIVLILVFAVAAAAFATNLVAAFHVFMGAFVYGVVYTIWLKRRTWWNIVVGGLAGSFALLAGASAVDPTLAPAPIILAVVLFLWTPPHFWSLAAALHDEYAQAGVPMLPVVVGFRTASWIILAHTVVLVALSILPVFFGLGWIYGIGAALGGFLFVRASIAFVRRPTRKTAMANFKASLIQLGLLQIAAIADYLVAA